MKKRFEKHGYTGTPEYLAWRNMIDRCTRPNHFAFKNYGARGILVCPEWIEGFRFFIEDMGDRPSPEHSLDRIDNAKGYQKDNCAWTTRRQQTINRRVPKKASGLPVGVSMSRNKKTYSAIIKINGVRFRIGAFDTAEAARESFLAVYKEWYGKEFVGAE